MTKRKPITIDEVIYLRDKLREEYSDLRKEWELDQEFYDLAFRQRLAVPKEFEDDASVLPTARLLVDVYTDHVDLANARVTAAKKDYNPDDPKDVEKAEKAAEMQAKFGRGLLYRWQVEEDISPLRVMAKYQGAFGLGVGQLVYDPDRHVSKPERKDAESTAEYDERMDEWRHTHGSQLPIVLRPVHPLNILPDPSSAGRSFNIEVREKYTIDVRDQYPRWSNPQNRLLADKVKLTSFWNETERVELADDEPLKPTKTGIVKHGYGFNPYILIESGYGMIPHDGDYRKRYVGLLRYLRDMLVSESRNFSIYDVALKKGALPWYTAEGDNADQLTANMVDSSYAGVTKLPKGVKLVKQTPDVGSDALMRQVDIINLVMMNYGAPRSVQGVTDSSVRSAAHARTLADLGGVRFQYPSETFRNKAAKILSRATTLYINKVPDDIRLWARTPTDEFDTIIDKKLLQPPFTYYVEFAPYSEEKEYIKGEYLMKMVQAGIVTPDWARKQLPNVDAKQMEVEDHKRMITGDPAVQQQLGQIRIAMMQAAIERKMIEEDIKRLPPPGAQAAPEGRPVMQGSPAVLSKSSPKPLPGSVGEIDNRLASLAAPVSPPGGP